jgi:hypothetical protein
MAPSAAAVVVGVAGALQTCTTLTAAAVVAVVAVSVSVRLALVEPSPTEPHTPGLPVAQEQLAQRVAVARAACTQPLTTAAAQAARVVATALLAQPE